MSTLLNPITYPPANTDTRVIRISAVLAEALDYGDSYVEHDGQVTVNRQTAITRAEDILTKLENS